MLEYTCAFVWVALLSCGSSEKVSSLSERNVVLITLDDVGSSDIGGFGAEWSTERLDAFLSDASTVSLSSHYNGYSDGASRSQLLTGVYGWHSGVGKLGDSFGMSTVGGAPLSTSTLADYMKELGGYQTYYYGAWGLGHAVSQQTPTQRGFDEFFGSYSLDTHAVTKTQQIDWQQTDPSAISSDITRYLDFWHNDISVDAAVASRDDSISQYVGKFAQMMQTRAKSHDAEDAKPFFAFLSLQGASQYFESSFKFGQEYDESCESVTIDAGSSDMMKMRHYTCQYMQHLDTQFGRILDAIRDEWERTLIILVSDNGGSLGSGGCNFPLRGGKGSYFEGSVRSVAVVGGGAMPQVKQLQGKGRTLNALMSNVDWAPTILSFTGLLPQAWSKVTGLDGYNMHSYLVAGVDDLSLSARDHILLDLDMFGTEIYKSETAQQKRAWAWDDKTEAGTQAVTMTGVAIVFYDEQGHLMKYYVSNRDDEVTDEDVDLEFNWCVSTQHQDKDVTAVTTGDLRPFSGLYDLSADKAEMNNLLRGIKQDEFAKIKQIVQEKTDFYLNSKLNERSKYVYDAFDCLYQSYNILAYPKARGRDATWGQMFDSLQEFADFLAQECGFATSHPMYEAHASESTVSKFEDKSDLTNVLNARVPQKQIRVDSDLEHMDLDAKQVEQRFVKSADTQTLVRDNKNVYSSCTGLQDGKYYVQIGLDATKPVLSVQCSNEYMLIDYNSDNNWKDYFSSWIQFHWQVASPFKSDYADMTEWFLPDAKGGDASNYNYLISHDCDVCSETSLHQTEGVATTYWQSVVPHFCGSADKGVNGADQMWNYQCRRAMFSLGSSAQELIDIWHMTDENGIDRDVLLTQLADATSSHLGICSTLKLTKDYTSFSTQYECASGTGGEMPVIGMQGQFCVCAKESEQSKQASKRAITVAEEKKLRMAAIGAELEREQRLSEDKPEQQDKVFNLYAKDFEDGTLRIRESGTYVLMEDVVFDYNAPDYEKNADYSANQFDAETGDMHWYPKQTQKDEYPGAYEYRDPYHLGFFAGITIEVDDVVLDLGGHAIAMDERYFFQQPFWSHIQIGSNNFIPGKGPAPLGADPTFVSNIVIKNGVLGLTSHHCIHGTSPKHSEMANIRIESITCKEFTTHGIQLNGFNGLVMENVEVGPTNNKHLLTSDYSNMRTLLPRFKYFADYFGDSERIRFGGKPSKEYLIENNIDLVQVSLNNEDEYTLSEILDEAIEQMDMAFDFVTGRRTEDELLEEYGLTWRQAKRVFVYDVQGGVPYGGSLYGVYLNYPGTGITGFYTNNEVSKNVEINNLYIHDLTHGTVETMCLTDTFKSVFGVAVAAQKMVGEANLAQWDDISTIQQRGEFYYYGTIVYDLFMAFYDLVSQDANNIDALNLGAFDDVTLKWAKTGLHQTEQAFLLRCGNDPMFHAVKGMYGLRLSGIEGARVSNVRVENMREVSGLGVDVCGTTIVFSQQQPYMYGYSGNNVHSVSIIHSDVLFKNIKIDNIRSDTGHSTGMSIYSRSNVVFEGNMNAITNIMAGGQYLDENLLQSEVLDQVGEAQYPNALPQACAVKAEDFGVSEALVSVTSLGQVDGTKMSVSCVQGYSDCDQNDMGSTAVLTDFGDVTFGNECANKMQLMERGQMKQLSEKNDVNDMNDVNEVNMMQEAGVHSVVEPQHVGYSLTSQVLMIGLVVAGFAGLWLVCYHKALSWTKWSARWNGYERI